MRTAILGAGVLGLTSALRLAEAGHDVTVLERSDGVGGLASSFELAPGIWLERFYHHLFRSDRHAVALIRELGLEGDLVWSRPRTVTFLDGEYRQLDSAGSLLRFTGLSPSARLRMGATLAVLRSTPSPVGMHDVEADRWLRRTMGSEAFGRIWEPLLRGKFADHADTIALAWFWARIHDRSARLGYLRGGFHRMYEALGERALARGARFELGVEVRQVRETGVELEVAVDAPDSPRTFDVVLSTLPSAMSLEIAPQLPETFRERYLPPASLSAQCLVLALDRPVVPAYWVNVNDPGFPFVTVVQHTDLAGTEDYGGRVLAYIGRYCPPDDSFLELSAADLLTAFEPSLRRLHPAFRMSWVTSAWAFSAPFAQPIVTTGYRAHVAPFVTPLRGYHLANMFQIYPHDRGQNQSIALAELAAAQITQTASVGRAGGRAPIRTDGGDGATA
jgi:protoporphyrinogen oxidase